MTLPGLNPPSRFTRRTIWLDKRKWPSDSERASFVCRAVVAIGERRYGQEWCGHKAAGHYNELLPSVPDLASPSQRRRVEALVRLRYPRSRADILKTEIWTAAIAELNTRSTKLKPALEQFQWALQRISNALISGSLVAYLVDEHGVSTGPVPTALWRKRALGDPFTRGVACLSASRTSDSKYCWVYVGTEQLRQLLSGIEPILLPSAFPREDQNNVVPKDQRMRPVRKLGINNPEVKREYEKLRASTPTAIGRTKMREWAKSNFGDAISQKVTDELARRDAKERPKKRGRPSKTRLKDK